MAGMLSTGAVFAQQDTTPGPEGCPCMGMMGKKMNRADMMQWHQKMVDRMKAQDAELDRLAQEMNAAQGDKKVDAIAALINKMMENRKAWHAEMEAAHKKMMEMKGTPEGAKMEAGKTRKGMKASPSPQ